MGSAIANDRVISLPPRSWPSSHRHAPSKIRTITGVPTSLADPVPFNDLRALHTPLIPSFLASFGDHLQRSDFILGEAVQVFEDVFASYLGVSGVVGVSSGLDALRLVLQAEGIGPGDEVIVPAHTFIATALGVSAVGATPVLVDCDPSTYTIDVAQIEHAVTARTRAILPVHLYGQSADMAPITEVATRLGLAVFEDAAQSHGVRYRGAQTGTLGTAGCFSFYPGKNLGALGDGGAISSDDPVRLAHYRRLRDYGQAAKYDHVELGLNARLDTVQASFLAIKLPHLDRWNACRAAVATQYDEGLAGIGDIVVPARQVGSTHVFHLYVVQTAHRDALQAFLAARQIATGIHYPKAIHQHPAYGHLGYTQGTFPVAERLVSRCLTLPVFPDMSEMQVTAVIEGVRAFFDGRHDH
jgi:dTDP-4-amino-4,6-dideoxygalactose transaminase